jgi:Dolichyl-phosphate-mannose-protein mannosyltransferase
MRLERCDLIACGALALLGSCAFIRLMAVPAFEDEATQLRWISRAVQAGEWLQPLSEGKPLEVWPMIPLARCSSVPLTAIRRLHVFVGMTGAVLTYLLARRLGSRLQAFMCGALFAICPFVVYMQRLALTDMLLCPAGIAVLLGTLALCESPTHLRAGGVALALVLAAFCKFPVGFVFVTALPLALLLMPAGQRRALLSKPRISKLLVSQAPVFLLILTVLAVVTVQAHRGKALGFGIQALRGIAMGHYAGISTGTGVPRPSLAGELNSQLSWPVTLIWVVGLAAGAFFNDWRHRWLIAAGALPLLAIGLLADYWFSRYLLFTLPPLIIAAVAGWATLARRAGRFRQPVTLGLLTLCGALMGWQSSRIILNPLAARWSPLDRFQYFEGWGSGYGYPSAASFLVAARTAPATLFSLDGHSAYQLLTYLPAEWSNRVRLVMYGDDGRLLRTEQERLDNLLAHAPAAIIISPQLLDGYLTSSFGPAALEHFDLRRIASFDKPGGRTQVALYEATRR